MSDTHKNDESLEQGHGDILEDECRTEEVRADDFFETNHLSNSDADDAQKILRSVRKFLVPALVGALISVGIVFIASRGSSRSFSYHLCNGLFVAAVILMGIGGLTMINKQGLFDIILFGFRQIRQILFSGAGTDGSKKVDRDFNAFKKEKFAKRVGLWNWLLVGLFYFLAAFFVLKFFYTK